MPITKMKSPKSNQIPNSNPRLLKDFLSLDSNPIPTPNTRSANSTKVSAFLNALKNIHFTAILRRTLLSRRASGDRRETGRPQIQLKSPTIKDIIRWKSFRDLEDSEQNTTTTTTSATSSPTGSSGSSWCGSDSTAEYLPWWMDGNLEEKGKKCLPGVGEGTKTKSDVGPESPISVMDNVFEEECWTSSQDEQYITVECTGREQWVSYREMNDIEVEEKAWQIFTRTSKTRANNGFNDVGESEKRLVYDFIKQDLIINKAFEDEDSVIRRVKEWLNGEDKLWIGWDKKEACIREMDESGKWNKFEEENEEMGVEIEVAMVNFLVDELLLDLITCS